MIGRAMAHCVSVVARPFKNWREASADTALVLNVGLSLPRLGLGFWATCRG